jgi:hypothetical protein
MTLTEMKKKVLSLIEELNPLSEYLTDDPDIQAKINDVINQILYEMARFKKIPKYVEMNVNEGDLLEFADIEKVCGYEIYQIDIITGVRYVPKANGTVLKMMETGIAEISCFVYPERITEKTRDGAYEFELSNDALEICPYGIAADLLKADVSTQYGREYAERYNEMLSRLDHRYHLPTMYIDGGIDV